MKSVSASSQVPCLCRTPQGVRGLKYTIITPKRPIVMSHPARGAWIEIDISVTINAGSISCRTPQGVRGLKSIPSKTRRLRRGRTPQGVRGLKLMASIYPSGYICRTPQGVRGLKCISCRIQTPKTSRRTPQGVRGLKFIPADQGVYANQVAPRKGCVD